MTTFFAIGIALNVVLTGLALYWLWRQRAPRRPDAASGESGESGAPAASNDFLAARAGLLISSYRRWTGRDLVDPALSPVEQARALYQAPFVVAAHGTEADPVFNYANRAALSLFDAGWRDFTAMPSRLSAEPAERGQRARFLERVNRCGFIDDYSGVRVSAAGRRFRIRHATVWNVTDAAGAPAGQAVMFRDWEYL